MKKILLSVITTFFFLSLQAQVCVPDTTISTGMFPPGATTWDTILMMPDANVGLGYSEVLQIKAPKDTTITVPISATLAIDSIKFLDIIGLPTSITYVCDNSRCVWIGGGHGCATFKGIPQIGEIGTYTPTIIAYVWVNGGPLGPLGDTALFSMEMVVNPPIGLEENSIENSFKISPNPIKTKSTISFNAPGEEKYLFKIIDVTGRRVFEKSAVTQQGTNAFTIQRNNLPDGVYIYLLETEKTQKTGRLIFTH